MRNLSSIRENRVIKQSVRLFGVLGTAGRWTCCSCWTFCVYLSRKCDGIRRQRYSRPGNASWQFISVESCHVL